ncbi:MAG TPA: DUF4126 domain-containing protein [Candidatus Polarisedimenticolia bacterium]|nr:DUF4126 domain-containing protein [Candidatus Polarisedimenticolia bacterium]
MELLLSLCIGIGLSAACGFRVFVPLLIMSIAAKTGHLTLVPAFQWIGSDIALWTFAIATVLEIGTYYIPLVHHALDVIATPVAIIAGIMVTASIIGGMDPFLKWTLAVIAGGGAAGLIHGATTVTRGVSTATTGGVGNPIFATIELGSSFLTSVLAVMAPVAAIVILALILLLAAKKLLPKFRKRKGAVQ